ncbi:hypothetical protein [Brevibacillus massiliensis]|uniref:hypothetical protein n=1 Tax=Brevibacillus massiliensis TaxID=1118054 RepID=UPI0002E02A07|nr:hypothetical protein [Brevibacillus massiliensis]
MFQLWWNEITSRLPDWSWLTSPESEAIWLAVLIGALFSFTLFFLLLWLVPSRKRTSLRSVFEAQLRLLREKIQAGTTKRIGKNKWEGRYFEKFASLVHQAGKPYGIEPVEWWFIIFSGVIFTVVGVFGQMIIDLFLFGKKSFPLLFFTISLLLCVGWPLLYLKWKANKRRTILFYDLLRAIGRLSELLDFHISHYELVRRSLISTRKLKEYIPRLDEWNASPKDALQRMETQIGLKEGILLTNTIRYAMENTIESTKLHLVRLENSLRILRQEEERIRTKRLELGFSVWIIPPFVIAFVCLAFPWYRYFLEMMEGLM